MKKQAVWRLKAQLGHQERLLEGELSKGGLSTSTREKGEECSRLTCRARTREGGDRGAHAGRKGSQGQQVPVGRAEKLAHHPEGTWEPSAGCEQENGCYGEGMGAAGGAMRSWDGQEPWDLCSPARTWYTVGRIQPLFLQRAQISATSQAA